MSTWHSVLDEAIVHQAAHGFDPADPDALSPSSLETVELDWTKIPALLRTSGLTALGDGELLYSESHPIAFPSATEREVARKRNQALADSLGQSQLIAAAEVLRQVQEPSKAQVCGMTPATSIALRQLLCPQCHERAELIGGGERGEIQVWHCSACGWDEEDDGWPTNPAA